MGKVYGWAVGNHWSKQNGVILHTEDGIKWDQQDLPEGYEDFYINHVTMDDKQNAFIVGKMKNDINIGGLLFKHKDSEKWQYLDDGIQYNELQDVKIIGNQLWASGMNNTVLMSESYTDISWKKIYIPDNSMDFQVQGIGGIDEKNIYLARNSNTGQCDLLKSTDCGVTWNKMPISCPDYLPDCSIGFIGAFALSENTIFGYGGVGLLVKTVDAGKSWNYIMQMGTTGIPDNNGLFALSEDSIWVARDDGLLQHGTPDPDPKAKYGMKWTKVDTPLGSGGYLLTIDIVDNMLFIGSEGMGAYGGGVASYNLTSCEWVDLSGILKDCNYMSIKLMPA